MATTLGPRKLITQQTISNSSRQIFSLVTGQFIGNQQTNTVTTTYDSGQFPTIPELAVQPIANYITINLNSNIDTASLEVVSRVVSITPQYIMFGSNQYSSGSFAVRKGVYYQQMTNYGSKNIINANSANEIARKTFPSIFPVSSGVTVDSNGTANGKLYISVFFVPMHIPDTFTETYPEYEFAIEVYGKEIIESTPPPQPAPTPSVPPTPKPTPTTTTEPKATPPTVPATSTPRVPASTQRRSPIESQLSVRVIDLDSQALYGVLIGPEFESEYIETTRQAIRVGEQIIWQSNQVLIFAWSTPFDPTVRRGQTVQIKTAVYAQENFVIDVLALIKSVSHVFDTTTGEVTTQLVARAPEYVFQSNLADSDRSERLDQRQGV